MKNSQSKFAQTLGTMYQSRNRLLLTGTPLQACFVWCLSLLSSAAAAAVVADDVVDVTFVVAVGVVVGGACAVAIAVPVVLEDMSRGYGPYPFTLVFPSFQAVRPTVSLDDVSRNATLHNT